jgi:excinuclease ABC subunit A
MADVRIHHARAHNLRDISLTLPAGALTVLTGVSGSGKSSLAFDTVHAEGRRRYLEALGAQDGSLRRPPVEAIEGLPPTLSLRQHTRAPGPRETVGSRTEAADTLGVVWARAGVQHDPETGEAIRPVPHDLIVRDLLARPAGTRLLVEAPLLPDPGTPLSALLDEVRRAGFSRVRCRGRVQRVDDVPAEGPPDPDLRVVVDRLKLAPDRRPRLAEALRTAGAAGRGVIVAVLPDEEAVYVDRPFSLSTRRTFPDLSPALFSPRGLGRCPTCEGAGTVDGAPCPDCGGARLREAARHVRYGQHTLPEVLSWPATVLAEWLEERPPDPRIDAALDDARGRVGALLDLGLGHLPLHRPLQTLSGGEARRLRLARLVGADLAGVLYVLDEPTAGLAADAVPPVLATLDRLRARGNTLLVVSHREEVVRRADQVVELGPGAGTAGGRLLFAGAPEELAGLDTPTGRWLGGRLDALDLPPPSPASERLSVDGTVLHTGRVHVLTGPAGAGSTRRLQALAAAVAHDPPAPLDRVLQVDDARTGSTRSMVATFTGAWDTLRELLAATTEARIRGLTASHFSLATRGGRCEACKGQGEVKVELGMLPPVWLTCEVCDGRRFQEDVLDITWKAHSPAGLLDLEAEAAWRLLAGHPRLDRALRALVDVGLGYVPLGQSTASLSGGEAARLRLARELGRTRRGVDGALVVMDGPTDGLHPLDAHAQITLLHRLTAAGATVVVASHDPRVVEAAHHHLPLDPLPG